MPLDTLATPELVRSLVDVSHETGRQVGVLVHRSGAVEHVVVGDANRLMLPDIGRLRAAEGRFRGLRLVHTHVRGEPLTKDDFVDLVRLRLDLVCAIHMAPNGEPRGLSYAYNVPTSADADANALPYREVPMLPLSQQKVHVGELMADLEAEFAKRGAGREVRAKDGRAILVHVASTKNGERKKSDLVREAEASMRELRELARTAGVEVTDSIVQIRDAFDTKYVMGKGKLDDVILRAIDKDAEVLVFDQNLSPAQAAAVAKVSDLKVIDRSQLILDIFAQRAEGRDGKLQVELAQLKYSLPRLAQKDDALSRLTGGIGGRGPGETTLEVGKRRAKERVSHLEAELAKLEKRREERRKKRTRVPIPTVAVVGYTNAGKSTLLNTLTGADVLAEDKLFATLDTRSRVLRVGWAGWGEREVVLTDTVGFIRNLPKDLFAAFRATFEEAADADLLLHVVDASDPARDDQVRTTEELLAELHLEDIPRIVVWNKIDALEPFEAKLLERSHPADVHLSANDRESTRGLLVRIAETLASRWDDAAKGPALVPPEAKSTANLADLDADAEPNVELSSVEDMLRAANKRVRRPGPQS